MPYLPSQGWPLRIQPQFRLGQTQEIVFQGFEDPRQARQGALGLDRLFDGLQTFPDSALLKAIRRRTKVTKHHLDFLSGRLLEPFDLALDVEALGLVP